MTNLQTLRPSRKKQQAGDVFAMQLPDGRYLFGRVISTTARIGPMGNVLLLYIYRARSAFKRLPDRAELRPDRLLVSPLLTNQRGWTEGLFETIAQVPLDDNDVLEQHCFLDVITGSYFDESSNELCGPIEPVGDFGLHSFRTIDDEISDALGIVRAPD